jgi:hypothetical protein
MNSLKLAAILYKLSSLSPLAAAIFLLPALFGVQACRKFNISFRCFSLKTLVAICAIGELELAIGIVPNNY